MASAGLSRAVGKIIIGCVLVAGVINVGSVVANEKISPQMFNALLMIMGKPVDSDDDGVNDFDDDFPNDPAETRDTDGDGVGDNADEFPADPREFRDSDGDGLGNNADPDDDNDNVTDDLDAFPLDPNESVDTDEDGVGNNADTDDDNDNVDDDRDAFPLDPSESLDTDNDGIGNNADPDDDNDRVEDSRDAFPLDPAASLDTDNDGIGNNADPDDDNDTVEDSLDAFPLDPAASVDTDGDGMPDDWNDGASAIVIGESPLTVDDDDDNDGIPDVDDRDPLYPHYFYGTSVLFDLPFGGATVEENGNYLVPASAEAFAGYANSETYQYPMVFEYGGELVFDAFVPSGEAVDVRFRFERKPYDENDASATEPSFETEPLTISGALPQTYRVEIPAQGSNTFSSLILYIDTRDVAVNFNYAYINAEPEPVFATFDGVFGGFIADNDYFFFPSDAETYAGVANTNIDLYPLIFPAGGQISFMAAVPVGGFDTSVYFRFENLPFPDNDPFFDTETRVISGEPARYVIDIPATGYEQTYSSLLMYIVERDQGVKVWDVEVESFYETEVDSDNDGYADSYDAFPEDPAAAIDTDFDGMPDDWNVDATEQ